MLLTGYEMLVIAFIGYIIANHVQHRNLVNQMNRLRSYNLHMYYTLAGETSRVIDEEEFYKHMRN